MDVAYSNNVTNTIRDLRTNVYSKDEFKDSFSDKLQNDIGATDINFLPDKFGGWSVNITTPESSNNSSSYVSKITNILIDTIHSIKHAIPSKDIACNLANVIVAGQGSIVVKL